MINIGLRLPVPEIEALLQGKTIVAITNNFLSPGRKFAIYPSDELLNILPVERYYNSSFLSTAQTALTQLRRQGILLQPQQMNLVPNSEQLQIPLLAQETVLIQAWAKCELCQIFNDSKSLAALSKLTIWTQENLEEILKNRQNIFLAYLRVYQLNKSIELIVKSNSNFVALPQPLNVTGTKPVLSDQIFSQRKRQLENLEPPLHPELENLQNILSQIAKTDPEAQQLENDIKIYLGWGNEQTAHSLDSDLSWIKTIADVGNSSDGNGFEKLVRRGLLKLGFIGSHLNPNASGGAGGMDFYAEYPYPIVGECKATKTEKVSDGTPAQLLKIGMNHLEKFQYEKAIKLIVAAGELNSFALRTVTQNEMNVIRPETLQRLVELHTHYKNSVNLLELKECLQKTPYGLADDKVNHYIDKVEQEIKLRSHVIQVVKKYLEDSKYECAGVEAIHAVYVSKNPPQELNSRELRDILVELSSPLTGYLGWKKAEHWRSDRFYYLRDLTMYT